MSIPGKDEADERPPIGAGAVEHANAMASHRGAGDGGQDTSGTARRHLTPSELDVALDLRAQITSITRTIVRFDHLIVRLMTITGASWDDE